MCMQNKICMPKKNSDLALIYIGFQCLEGEKKKQTQNQTQTSQEEQPKVDLVQR